MANKRQRLARRRVSQSTASITTDGGAGTVLKAKSHKIAKAKRKAVRRDEKTGGSKRKTGLIKTKHPLRVPGKKPGDGCFICKSTDHVARACPHKLGKDRKKICLFCREIGHTLKNCPSKQNGQERKFCYNCGEAGHRLAECKEPLKDGGTSFAECFLCKEKGHLSKNCPSNAHGIYPKGGSCKICGGVTHLAKDCPEKGNTTRLNGAGRVKLHISKEAAPTLGNHARRVVFGSGDDLEDDFVGMEDDEAKVDKEHSSPKPKGQAWKSKTGQISLSSLKPVVKKVKSSPKVVNFLK